MKRERRGVRNNIPPVRFRTLLLPLEAILVASDFDDCTVAATSHPDGLLYLVTTCYMERHALSFFDYFAAS
jgi:hypothetical protein